MGSTRGTPQQAVGSVTIYFRLGLSREYGEMKRSNSNELDLNFLQNSHDRVEEVGGEATEPTAHSQAHSCSSPWEGRVRGTYKGAFEDFQRGSCHRMAAVELGGAESLV